MQKLAVFQLLFPILFVSFADGSPSGACLNNGIPLNSTTCLCPAYVDGKYCENVKCQRFSIPDKNRCACPPGWYDKYCGLRGCRPPNEDNLNLSKRSFIIVFNTKTSMRKHFETLISRFNNLIKSITKGFDTGKVDNWIENYIFYGFVQKGSNLTVQKFITEDSDEFLKFLKTSVRLSEGDEQQPVLTALKTAQQTYPTMRSHAIVLVFTDSPASDATSWSHRFTDKNVEQACLQISLLWRSKVSFILSLSSVSNMSSDGVDVYRRLSLTNHGDTFFVHDEAETSEILTNVISTYYFPENLATGFGISGNASVEAVRDDPNDTIFVLITFDSIFELENSVPVIDLVNGTIYSQGSSYKLFTYNGSASRLKIATSSEIVYNYRVFIQSKNTLLIDYNDDMTIDVGNGMAVIGIGMSATMKLFGFDTKNLLNSSYHVLSSNNSLIRENYFSFIRPQLDCTFDYGFEVWNTLEFKPGPITQFHTLYYDGFVKQRVTTGYCIQSDHNDDQQSSNASGTGKVQNANSCGSNDVLAKNDPRLEGPKQFIFILEQHPGSKAVYQNLTREIWKVVEFTKMDNNYNEQTYRNEYTLITHCDKESHILLTTYNPDIFARKFPGLIYSINYVENLDNTMGLLSVVQAQKLNIQPTSQVFYFTNQNVKSVQNISRTWDIVDKTIEFNFFTISDDVTTDVFSLPWQLELIQKMSNGRVILLRSSEETVENIFSDIIGMNALTTDSQNYDCHTSPFEVETFVEVDAASTNIQVIGTGIDIISIQDKTGFPVNFTSYLSYRNSNLMSILIRSNAYEVKNNKESLSYLTDFANQHRLTAGTWKIRVSTTQEGCQVTVRQRSNIKVVVGFSGNLSDSPVESHIPTQRSAPINASIYVPIQVVAFQRTGNAQLVPTSLTIENVNSMRYYESSHFLSTNITKRDQSSCSYEYTTPRIPMPQSALSLFTITGVSNGSTVFVRRFYFYQHFPSDPSMCHGGKVDQYGQCICPPNYTGEYCWDRICATGATSSYGMCSCPPGFYGDFCEIKLIIPNGNSSTSTTKITIESTTKSCQNKIISFLMIFSFLLFSLSLNVFRL